MQTDPAQRFEDADQAAAELQAALAQSELTEAGPWTPERYLEDPDEWESRLQAHLEIVLLDRGRAAFADGNHLDAQRLFNRLLAWNPEHPEVLELLSSFHHAEIPPPTQDTDSAQAWPWIGAGAALLLAGLAWVFLQPPATNETSPEEPVSVAPPEPTLPVSPVDLQTPEAIDPLPPAVDEEPPKPKGTKAGVVRDIVAPPPPGDPTVLTIPQAITEAPKPAFVRVALDAPTWGDVYIDGELVFNGLRQPQLLETSEGTHRIQVSNPMSTEFSQEFTVEAGETLDITASLKELLMTITLDGFSPLCEVSLGGQSLGTVESQNGTLRIKAPRQAAKLSLACPDGSHSFDLVGAPGDAKTIAMP